jgi:hypothetical protein
MPITCHHAKRSSTAYVDGRLRKDERLGVAAHLAECGTCASYFEEVMSLRTALQSFQPAVAPNQLTTSLRVIASRERASVIETHGSRWSGVWDKWKLRLDNIMRPLAIPATGGLVSSLLLFGVFVLTIGSTSSVVGYDVPLNRQANLVPVELGSHAVFVNMSVGSNGRLANFAMNDPTCKLRADLQGERASITVPAFATVFGLTEPISGDIQIRFQPLGVLQ